MSVMLLVLAVLVTAFAYDPAGDETLLRIWEHAGATGPCEIRLPKGLNITHAQPVDLRGRPAGQPLTVADGTFSIDLKAFAPASFMLEGK